MSIFARLFGAAALTAALAGVAAAETTLTMNVWFPRMAAFNTRYMQAWADEVQARSNGAIRVVVPAQSMAPPPGQLQLLLDGGADVVIVLNGVHGDLFAPLLISEIPMTAETEEGA